jgi:predicted transglutaminase-like cysteine proteinase
MLLHHRPQALVSFRWFARLGLLSLLVSMLLALSAPAQAVGTLWGASGTFSSNLKNFPKWRGSMDRYRQEMAACGLPTCDKPKLAQLIESMRGLDPGQQVLAIQSQMGTDKFRYTLDIVNWGLTDYWETPFEFMRKNGDCEDYALSKYWTLRALGIPANTMQIVVLQDLNLGIAHAVLVVSIGGRSLLLDNQLRNVVDASTVRHYQPVYAVNEEGWWLFRR